jgi:hypothetical protein
MYGVKECRAFFEPLFKNGKLIGIGLLRSSCLYPLYQKKYNLLNLQKVNDRNFDAGHNMVEGEIVRTKDTNAVIVFRNEVSNVETTRWENGIERKHYEKSDYIFITYANIGLENIM